MQEPGKTAAKIAVFGVVCAILDVIFHAVLAPTYNYDYPAGYFIQAGLFKPVAGLSLWIIFVLLGAVFLLIRDNLPGSKLSKGIRFGVSFGGLWLIGVIGMSVFFGSPLQHEILGGACDCAAIIILGCLLGLYTAADSPSRSHGSPVRMIAAIITIALFFITGQYIAFLFMSGTSYFSITGITTFLWTVVLGIWAGTAYWLLREGVDTDIPLVKRSFLFGGVVIGIDWISFNLFVLLFVAMPLSDPFILGGLNIISIIAGMFVFERVFSKSLDSS